MKEEQVRILKMVEDGKISADEAARLLEALEKSDSRPTERELKRRWIHIEVTKDGEKKANIKIPLALLKFGFQFAPHMMQGKMEKKRARIERARERMQERIDRAREKARARLERELGSDADIEGILEGMFEGALDEEMASVFGHGAHIHGALGEALGKGVDLDLDKILEMAQQADFDGKILDVHDDEDGEHVVIRLE